MYKQQLGCIATQAVMTLDLMPQRQNQADDGEL